MSISEINTEGKCVFDKSESIESVSHDEAVDPRVQIELERLNTATDLINKLEIELDEARSQFRQLLSESSVRVNQMAKKLGSCVELARPYYEARMQAKQLQTQTQKAALRYERASSAHSVAKEMVYLAEEGLKKEGSCFDPAWQEMLNHATLRVNEAESERVLSQREHQRTSLAYNDAEKIAQQLHQELNKSIVKSSLSTRRSLLQLNNLANQHQLQLLPYFEMKDQFNQLLEKQRKTVHRLEENLLKVKLSYTDALHNLEEISEEIHQRRKKHQTESSKERNDSDGAKSPTWMTWNNLKVPYKYTSDSNSCDETSDGDCALHNYEEIHQRIKIDETKSSSKERSEGVGAESSSSWMTWDDFKVPYRYSSDCNSCDDIFAGDLSVNDVYMSLPAKLKGKSFPISGPKEEEIRVNQEKSSHLCTAFQELTLPETSNSEKEIMLTEMECKNSVKPKSSKSTAIVKDKANAISNPVQQINLVSDQQVNLPHDKQLNLPHDKQINLVTDQCSMPVHR